MGRPAIRTEEGLLGSILRRLTLLERRRTGGGTAPGTVHVFAGATAPPGYLLMDGASHLRADYPRLFGVIGTTYGAADGTHFNVPNAAGRVIVGRDAGQAEFNTLGETGGAKTHTLTIAEIPAHSHQYNAAATNSPGTQPANWDDIVGANSSPLGVGPVNPEASDNAIKSRGGGGAHNNLQPYIVLNYLIKT